MSIQFILENYFKWSMRFVVLTLFIGLTLQFFWKADWMLSAGIGALLFIPVGRVCITLYSAVKNRDRGLLIISATVLIGLAVSLVIGLLFKPIE